jgi:hypothetical protein
MYFRFIIEIVYEKIYGLALLPQLKRYVGLQNSELDTNSTFYYCLDKY